MTYACRMAAERLSLAEYRLEKYRKTAPYGWEKTPRFLQLQRAYNRAFDRWCALRD